MSTWSAFLVHYFLHSNKHTLLSLQYRTPSIVVIVMSLEANVFSPSFSIWTIMRIDRALLLGQLHSLCLSLLCCTPWGVCRYLIVVSCLHALRAQAWDAYSEMNMLLKKRNFFFLLLFYCWTASQSSDTRLFTPWYIHSSKKKLYTMTTVLPWCRRMQFFSSSFFLPFFFFLFFLFHLIILQ
jgi:hypothetical protein